MVQGIQSFAVTSNTDWTVSKDAEWINISPLSGSGNGTVTVTYEENQNTYQRLGTITITGGGITRTMTVSQDAHPFVLDISEENISVGYGSGNTTFAVTSNTDWTVNKDAEWINVSPSNGSGDGTVAVTYEENPNTVQRSGTITVTGGGITRTVTVTQDAQPFVLILTSSELNVEHIGGSATVYHNIKYRLDI